MDYPCKNCPDRAIGCHGHCEKYLAVREEQRLQESNAWRKRIGDIAMDDYKHKVVQRTKKQYDRSKFARAKNTAQGRGAIRAQTIVELEKKKDAQIIESYGKVTVTASADDPTVCLVEFSFAVAHGLNQIYLTVHLTV